MLAHHRQPVEKAVIHQFRELPPDVQQEALAYLQFLTAKNAVNHPHQGIKGLWANEGFTISEEDIEEARRECWGNFPREDIL